MRSASLRLPADGGRLAAAALVQSLGIGLYMASSMAYFTQRVGLSAGTVAGGLAAAGAVALGLSLLGGELSDRFGARKVLAALYAGRAVCFAAFAFVTDFWEFAVVTLVSLACDRSGPPVLQALVASAVTQQAERTRLLAVVNVLRNVGLGVGAAAAGAALTVNTLAAYRITLAAISVAFVGGALLVLRVREGDRAVVAAAPGGRLSRLPDRRYLGLTGLNFVLSFFDSLLLVAMPVWVLQHTGAPRATVSVLFTLNTALVVVFQIPVSRWASGMRRTTRMVVTAGAVMAVSSCCFAVAAFGTGWTAVGWLVAAVVALSLGEVITNSAMWTLSMELAPAPVRGRYLSVFNLGLAAERVLGPVVVTSLLLAAGTAGWAGAAVVFVAAGAFAARLAGGAVRRPEVAGGRLMT